MAGKCETTEIVVIMVAAVISSLGNNLVIIHGVRTDCFNRDALLNGENTACYVYYRDRGLTSDEAQQIQDDLNKINKPLFYILPDELCYNSLDEKFEETISAIMTHMGFVEIEPNYFTSYYQHG